MVNTLTFELDIWVRGVNFPILQVDFPILHDE